jgi:predicted ATP-grasp superfamily ATP-dependent carboligase
MERMISQADYQMPVQRHIKHRERLHDVAVVISGGGGTNALGAVRSLAAKGIRSVVACKSESGRDSACMSRLPLRKVQIPGDACLPVWLGQFIDSVADEADCVIPTTDESASALLKLRTEGALRLPCLLPPADLVDVLNDKQAEINLIENLGIALPASVLEMRKLGGQRNLLEFPIIVKPRTQLEAAEFGFKNRIIRGPLELGAFLGEHRASLEAFIAQEIIPGDEACQWVCNAVFDYDSNMVSAFTFRRLGTTPYLFGVTTFAVSKHNPKVKELSARIGRALNYTGPAMLEFKVDPRSGEYCYIETNPRLGMCNWFDTRCGVDNVYNAYALSVGMPPEINIDRQKEGITYLSPLLDLRARRQAKQPLWKAIRLYAETTTLKSVFPAWYWRDPLPLISLPLRALTRRLYRLKRFITASI